MKNFIKNFTCERALIKCGCSPGCSNAGVQFCLGAVLWVQFCLGAVLFGCSSVWVQSCLGAVLWVQFCLGAVLWVHFCMGAVLSGCSFAGCSSAWVQFCVYLLMHDFVDRNYLTFFLVRLGYTTNVNKLT